MSGAPFLQNLRARSSGRLQRLRAIVSSRLAAPYSQLFVVGDGSGWVLNEEAMAIHRIARQLGVPGRTLLGGNAAGVQNQRVFHMSQFVLPELQKPGALAGNRIGVAYYHGKPDGLNREFTACFDAICALHPKLWRVLVSHREMEDLVLSSGMDREKVHRIPIGIALELFPLTTPEARQTARASFGIAEDAVVVGSFQKDGVGWGDGFEPKLIKGPDILVSVLERLREEVPNLHVLLSGAARGYVRQGLTRANIPHTHRWVDSYAGLHHFYEACDLVLVTSREEGGPKAVLESMASGIPLVSTRVGQASDLIHTGVNGFLAPVADVDALVAASRTALSLNHNALHALRTAARATAVVNTYNNQLPLWKAFLS